MKRPILIAEDDPASAVLLTELLTRWGYDPMVVANGQEALDVLATLPVDLLLLDLQMPVLDGFATLAAVRGTGALAHLPVIALTAFAMREDRDRILAAGFDHHLTKPVHFGQLRQTIEAALAAADGETGTGSTGPGLTGRG
ncbi:MAG TPA: response regulator [Thermoanaerobaculia bacterium]|jgi:CheY-like chemotaxis protein|nr:response regulator [Thermoanaerobaculia bacterium]